MNAFFVNDEAFANFQPDRQATIKPTKVFYLNFKRNLFNENKVKEK